MMMQVGQLRTLLSDAADTDEIEIFVTLALGGAYFAVRACSQIACAETPALWCLDTGDVLSVITTDLSDWNFIDFPARW